MVPLKEGLSSQVGIASHQSETRLYPILNGALYDTVSVLPCAPCRTLDEGSNTNGRKWKKLEVVGH